LKVLITDAKLNSTLATVRSLGRLGLKIIAGDETKNAISFFSRYVYQRFIYPHPLENPQGFLEEVLNLIRLKRVGLIIPMTDYTLLLFSKYRDKFPPWAILPIPEFETIGKVVNKKKTFQIAKELNISTPNTIFVNSLDELPQVAYHLNYPVVIKSSHASYLDEENNQIIRGKILYAYHPLELIEKYLHLHQHSPYPLIQEFIEGEGYGFFTILDKEGNSYAQASHHRIREANPTGSASCLCESIPVDKAMKKEALVLLKAIGWWGPAMVEFKQDIKDKKFKLMEVNGRLWGSLSLFIHAQLDYPKLFYKLALGEKIPRLRNYKIGIKCRDLRGDINHLVQVLKGPPKDWSFSYPKRTKTIIDFLRFREKDLRYYNFYPQDIAPAVIDILQCLATLFKNFAKKIFHGI